LLRFNNIPLFGFSSAALIKEQQAKIPPITLSEAHDLYLKNKIIFIDARDPFSFEEGHIAGAINIYPDEVSLHAPSLKIKANQGFSFYNILRRPTMPFEQRNGIRANTTGDSNS